MTRTFKEKSLLFATHNLGKLEELEAIVAPLGITVSSNRDFDLPEPEETETTFVGNARIKAIAAMKATGLPSLADDSGIIIDGLDGAPGIYTADWAETPNGRDFKMAMARAWSELEERNAPTPRTARFHATLVMVWPDGHEEVFDGEINGQIVWPMRGAEGHGYDPIFMPDGHKITLGEMDPVQKNKISHRAVALGKLIDACFG